MKSLLSSFGATGTIARTSSEIADRDQLFSADANSSVDSSEASFLKSSFTHQTPRTSSILGFSTGLVALAVALVESPQSLIRPEPGQLERRTELTAVSGGYDLPPRPLESKALQFGRRTESLEAGLTSVAGAYDLFAIPLELAQVEELGKLPDDWDSYGAKAPSEHVRETAKDIVRAMHSVPDVLLRFITATGDAGIALRYEVGQKILTWKVDYDGESSIMVRRIGAQPNYYSVDTNALRLEAARHTA